MLFQHESDAKGSGGVEEKSGGVNQPDFILAVRCALHIHGEQEKSLETGSYLRFLIWVTPTTH